MDCRACMSPVPTLLYNDQGAGAVIDFMRRQHMEMVPIVDRNKKFVGLVSTEKLMRMLLPKSLGMMRGLPHASYLRESGEDLRERMEAIRATEVGDLINKGVHTVHPDNSLADALMVISEKQYVVPVLGDDGVLLGVISFFSIMHAVEAADGEGVT